MQLLKRWQENKDLIIDYKRVFSTPEGKRVLFDLMNAHFMLVPHNGDPFKEGQRSVVLTILNRMKVDVRAYEQMFANHEGEQE